MIIYDQADQAAYYAERSAYLCAIAGTEPELISEQNYADMRALLYATLSGARLIRAINELTSILFFSVAVGYPESMTNG